MLNYIHQPGLVSIPRRPITGQPSFAPLPTHPNPTPAPHPPAHPFPATYQRRCIPPHSIVQVMQFNI